MRTQNWVYFHNLVFTMMQQLCVEDRISCRDTKPQRIYEEFSDSIKQKLLAMKAGTLNRIAGIGISASGQKEPQGILAHHVRRNSRLGRHDSGRDFVTEIACAAIVTKICEILRKRALHRQVGLRLAVE